MGGRFWISLLYSDSPNSRQGDLECLEIIKQLGVGRFYSRAIALGCASGLKVKILERRDRVGGRTSAIESNGFRFDLGPTFFLYPRVLDEILRAAGTSLENEIRLTRLDPQYRVIFGSGGQLEATGEIERMERQIAALAPGDAGSFRSF